MTDYRRISAALVMRPASLADHLLDTATRHRLAAVATVHPTVLTELSTPAALSALGDVEVLITGWGAPPLDNATLAAAPRLRAVVHTGGSAADIVGPIGQARGIVASNAGVANGRPVAEYTLAMILLAGKKVLPAARLYRQRRATVDREAEFPHAGNHGRAVGLVGASRIGRAVIELLRPFELDVLVYDPHLREEDARGLGVTRVSELRELMRRCDVVSLHAPVLPETRHMVDRPMLALLPDCATLINTARGGLVDGDALFEELSSGRIDAVLDVTDPEPLPSDHPLWELPNVLITPHVAGSTGNELRRLGAAAVLEVERLAAGLPLLHPER